MILVSFLAVFLGTGHAGGVGEKACANQEHESQSWAGTKEVGKFAYPKPKNDILDYFSSQGLQKDPKKGKKKYPKYCHVCVDIAKKKMARMTKVRNYYFIKFVILNN